MATEPDAAADADEEPSEDTPDSDDADEAEDTPESEQPIDWEARYKEAQKAISRQGAELELLRRGEGESDEADDEADDDEADDAPPAQPQSRGSDRLEHDSWELAEQRYGPEALEAYASASRIWDQAETPADFIAAFEAYHDIRSNGGSKGDATAAATGTKKQSRAKAVEPRVDLNRTDAGPDPTDLDSQIEGARAKGDLKSFVHAATSKMGFASTKR
jgi:hypothetical protein